MPDSRAGLVMARRLAIALLLVLSLSFVSACSEQREYKQSSGRCIVHDTDRVFGIPWIQQEYDCPKDGG